MALIRHRYSNSILYESDDDKLRDCAIRAAEEGKNLEGANLEGAYLEGAYLRGAYLEGANLEGANLMGAYLEGAYLEGAYLRGANLMGAYLRGAYLEGAYLEGAYLEGAYLEGAYLEGEIIHIAPIQILNLKWDIFITEGFLRIGCQQHSHETWKAMDDALITDMHPKALSFWSQNKQWILALCDAHRAESKKVSASA